MSCVNSVRVVPSQLTLTHHDTFSGLQAIVDTNGSDCCGVRWTSGDTKVVKVNVETGAIEAVGVGTTYVRARAIDGSGKYGCCTVTVEPLRVEGVKSCPDNKILDAGLSGQLRALIEPARATNRSVSWTSANPNIATVSKYGDVVGVAPGTTYVTVTTDDGGFTDTCKVIILPVDATGVEFDEDYIELVADETKQLEVTVKPWNATNKRVNWSSSDMYVATVDSDGEVTAHHDGVATITAETVSGGHSATCTVRVDSREKVLVEKDGDFFTVTFVDGTVWKSVECDISTKLEELTRNGQKMTPDNIDNLPEYAQRYMLNYLHEKELHENENEDSIQRSGYTVQRLALLYVLDPLGIEYYMRTNACDHLGSTTEKMLFKDDVYTAIFGEPIVGRFRFIVNDEGIVEYGTYRTWDRLEYHTNAEVLFGGHNVDQWHNFLDVLEQEMFKELIGSWLDDLGISDIYSTAERIQLLSFSESAIAGVENAGMNYLLGKADGMIQEVVKNMFGWASILISALSAVFNAAKATYRPYNINDIQFYKKIQAQNYNVQFKDEALKLTMQHILDQCVDN